MGISLCWRVMFTLNSHILNTVSFIRRNHKTHFLKSLSSCKCILRPQFRHNLLLPGVKAPFWGRSCIHENIICCSSVKLHTRFERRLYSLIHHNMQIFLTMHFYLQDTSLNIFHSMISPVCTPVVSEINLPTG